MTQLLIASGNNHKLSEIMDKLAALGADDLQPLSLRDFGGFELPPETGATFLANARLKAQAAAHMSGLISLADDSGLTVDALAGAPGVYSARYAGVAQDDNANNRKLLHELASVPDAERAAQFRCVIVIAWPEGFCLEAEGVVAGHILREARGVAGFGYDPLFFLPAYGKSMAELTPAEKNRISHRALALDKALPQLLAKLADGC